MSYTIGHHEVPRPARSKSETKADVTNNAARAIIGSEVERREAKTAKLRQARLEHEAAVAAMPPVAKPKRARKAKPTPDAGS